MSTTQAIKSPLSEQDEKNTKLLEQYGAGPIHFAGTDSGLYERHLLFDNVIDQAGASARDRFEAFARSGRDVLSQRWVHTERTYDRQNPKRIYYLSMEFLIGRSLSNNVTNLLLDPFVQRAVQQRDLDWLGLLEQEITLLCGLSGNIHQVLRGGFLLSIFATTGECVIVR